MDETQETVESKKERMHDTTDRVAKAAHETIDRMADRGSETEERMRQYGRQAAERSSETRENIVNYIEKHPYAAVGIAAAAGFVLSSLIRR